MEHLPSDEQSRLQALHTLEVLDGPGDPALDDLVVIASALCDTPIALVSLVDSQRQWFAARYGLDVEQTPRCMAFCDHTLRAPEYMLVGDATADDRFATNPLVLGAPGIRAYAGVALVGSTGERYGSLCVIDTRPREFEPRQIQGLRALARRAVQALETLSEKRSATRSIGLLQRLLETMPDAVVTCDAHGRLEQFNRAARDWHGVDPRALPPDQWAEHFDLYASDGRTPLPTPQIPLLRAFNGERVRDQEIVIAPKGQPPRRVSCNGEPIVSADGHPLGAAVVMHDVTRERSLAQSVAEERRRLSAVLEGTDVGTWEWNIQTGETRFNERWAQIIGYSLDEISPTTIETWTRFVHPDDLEESGRRLEAHFRGETDLYDCSCRMRHKDGRWVWVNDRGRVHEWDDQGNPLWASGAHFEITELVEAREKAALEAARFQGAFHAAAHGVALVAPEGTWVDANQALCGMLGYEREVLLGMTFQQITHPEDLDKDMVLLQDTLSGQRDGYQMDKRYLHRDGSVIEAVLSVALVRATNGDPIHFVSQIQNVTAQRCAERLLLESEQRVSAALSAIRDPIVCLDHEDRITLHNPAAAALLQGRDTPPARLLDVSPQVAFWPLKQPDSTLSWAQMLHRAKGSGLPPELVMRCFDGVELHVDVQVTQISTRSGDESGLVMVLRDVSGERARTSEERRRALHDELTKLPNRRALTEAFERAASRTPGSLMLLDLDGFKRVNDELGHEAGDQVLVRAAAVMRAQVRPSDLVVRLGGDEFAVMLPGCSVANARRIGLGLVEALSRGLAEELPEAGPVVTASAGLTGFTPGQSLSTVLRTADEALYAAKAEGKNRLWCASGADARAPST